MKSRTCEGAKTRGVWTKYNTKTFETVLGTFTIDPQQVAVMGRLSIRFDH